MKPTNRALRQRPDLFAGDDVLAGLRAARKHLPCRLLYDARGAELFDRLHQRWDRAAQQQWQRMAGGS